ncbi:spore germination cell wall hydrolase CwlJ-like protein [Novosphingobium kunmingense]|uniref:Spore germination cell wall hydrolase CwlJ-like protein n=1 Tax=Novosphingobium kunmingense TaxID=1211806 RepID=A0A2N0I113_9SPHN|nr:cell wall hydrolase [Novosphingobium kunmingense]PKB24831.1 spore germination cell wall hydrolase CwlJ-like protein [Novosphingobium kunmingense]
MDLSPAFTLDTPPREFSARLPRRGLRTVGRRHRGRLRGRRIAVLLAMFAVPALAAPGGWQAFDIGNAQRSATVIDPMPFERSGDSFPGSAFYYLAPDPALRIGDGIRSDADGAIGPVDPLVGPLARALRVDNSGVDRTRALQCLTAAIYYEAASEPDQGQRAVAQVVLNRVAHPSFPNTVCGVVYQGSERTTGCQFSFTCDGSLARAPSRFFWQRAMLAAQAALSGYVEPSVGLATHYHTIAVHPAWDRDMNHIRTIGAHMFFRWKSRAGDAANFRFAYLGGEPLAAPHPRNAAADRVADPSLDPLTLARAFEAGLKAAPGETGSQANAAGSVRASTVPTYSADVENRGGDGLYRGDRLPGGQQVRPEYANSGAWIAQPGT